MTSANSDLRLVLIDFFRLVCVFFILTFHTWMLFSGGESSLESSYRFFPIIEKFLGGFFNHSGIFIVAISFFLFGFFEKKLQLSRFFIFFAGMLLAQYRSDIDGNPWSFQSWQWGVFSFLSVAYAVLFVTQPLKDRHKVLLYLGTIALIFIQPYQVSALLPEDSPSLLKQALVGEEISENFFTGWYLFPWLFYPLTFFGFGIVFRLNKATLQRWHWKGDCLFSFAVIFSLIVYALTKEKFYLDGRFDKSVFDKDYFTIIGLTLFPLWIFRLSLLDPHRRAGWTEAFRLISTLNWNKYFWLTYLIQLYLLYVAYHLQASGLFEFQHAIELLVPGIFTLSEVMSRQTVKTLPKWQGLYRSLRMKKGE